MLRLNESGKVNELVQLVFLLLGKMQSAVRGRACSYRQAPAIPALFI